MGGSGSHTGILFPRGPDRNTSVSSEPCAPLFRNKSALALEGGSHAGSWPWAWRERCPGRSASSAAPRRPVPAPAYGTVSCLLRKRRPVGVTAHSSSHTWNPSPAVRQAALTAWHGGELKIPAEAGEHAESAGPPRRPVLPCSQRCPRKPHPRLSFGFPRGAPPAGHPSGHSRS